MEATGYSRWFERLLAELDFELWIGDPAEIEAQRVKKRKTDREDARLLLKLMREDRFPQIWGRVQRIGICDNYCGTGIVWCRCARGSGTNCKRWP
jgi:transposase